MKELILIGLMVINLILVGCLFLKDDTKSLEVLKVGGIENYKTLEGIYLMDTYITNQTQAINAFKAQLITTPITGDNQ